MNGSLVSLRDDRVPRCPRSSAHGPHSVAEIFCSTCGKRLDASRNRPRNTEVDVQFKVQIRDENDHLLTEWVIGADDTAAPDIAREIEWLRRPWDNDGKTNAEALAESAA